MPEIDEENRSFCNFPRGPPPAEESPVMMTMDLDLDGSWTFDQIFSSDPAPSFVLSASDQPFSPLWAFSDDNNLIDGDNKTTGNASFTPAGATLRLLSNGDEIIRKADEKRRVELPLFGVNPSTCVIKERMTLALRYLKESSEKHILAQVWAPVKNGSRYVLTTSGQPFVLDPNCSGLHHYRMASLMYMFSVDGETEDGVVGLPGRVFRQKLPEWTPDVQYYSDKEYPRLNHALSHDVRGTLALPVFEPSGQSCVGVLELILTSQQINYAPEVDKVCKALEAVNLKSSNILDHPNTQICNESRQNALAEILEILTVVCETHNFPLAQTWVPCRHRSVLAYGGGFKKSCSSFDGSCMGQVCMSTTDVAFYVVDAHMWGFREACAEHHLQKGQGVAGRAFATRSSCFCENITRFCKTEYPLVHYARMFGLVGSFAICLRSSYTGDDDYVLEFFLPPKMVDVNEQQRMLGSLLTSMKQHFRSLKVASGEVIGEDGTSVETIEASVNKLDFDSSNGGPLVRVDSFDQPQMAKKLERKRGKAEKSISLEVLQQYFAGSLKDAAKSLGVCPTTMKRICRQHGISRWPSRKINKVNRSLTKLKRVIESVQGGAEGTFTIPSLQLPHGVDSTSPKNDPGSREASTGSQTSHHRSPNLEIESVKTVESQPVVVNKQNLGVGLIEDAGSSHDLTNLYQVTECEKVQERAAIVQQCTAREEETKRVVTIKASYREDIIRFRVGANSGIVRLKEEVSKRLKLEMGTFDIKYLDDDNEWVLIACDADLQECVELSRSTTGNNNNNNNNSNIVRLLVHDLSTKLGSSCESSD